MNRLLKNFISDRSGRVVIAQRPNGPLLAWAALSLAARLCRDLPVQPVLAFFGSAFLFTWAWLELARGDSPFRRTLGAVVIGWMLVSRWPGDAW